MNKIHRINFVPYFLSTYTGDFRTERWKHQNITFCCQPMYIFIPLLPLCGCNGPKICGDFEIFTMVSNTGRIMDIYWWYKILWSKAVLLLWFHRNRFDNEHILLGETNLFFAFLFLCSVLSFPQENGEINHCYFSFMFR